MLKSIPCLIIGGSREATQATISVVKTTHFLIKETILFHLRLIYFWSNDLNGAANLSWTLFNGFGVKANKTKLEQLQMQSENTATLAIENTIHGVILAYYQAKQLEQLSLLQNILKLTKEKYVQQQIKSEIGI